jgi:hypothetical protein
MKTTCEYAIIRFLPFPETGEFANVGIVLTCPERIYFHYTLATRGWGRISKFFEGLDQRIYRQARSVLIDELARIEELYRRGDHVLEKHRMSASLERQHLFAELIRPRDGLVRFSAPRMVLAEEPAEALDELYRFYVEREFVTKEYQERVLDRGVRLLLSEASLGLRYRPHAIGDEEFHVNFPFVWLKGAHPHKAIKPLNLDQEEASGILDHGGHWVDRVRRLAKRGLLPDSLLFVAKQATHDARGRAAREITGDLQASGANVTEIRDRQAILAFAR